MEEPLDLLEFSAGWMLKVQQRFFHQNLTWLACFSYESSEDISKYNCWAILKNHKFFKSFGRKPDKLFANFRAKKIRVFKGESHPWVIVILSSFRDEISGITYYFFLFRSFKNIVNDLYLRIWSICGCFLKICLDFWRVNDSELVPVRVYLQYIWATNIFKDKVRCKCSCLFSFTCYLRIW